MKTNKIIIGFDKVFNPIREYIIGREYSLNY